MNIFLTSPCPNQCAKYLDLTRRTKMTLETAQMLSTAMYLHNQSAYSLCPYTPLKKDDEGNFIQTLKTKIAYYLNGKRMYAPTHKNHPCTVWIRETRANYRWALRHFVALCREYTLRYGKRHKCENYLKEFIEGAKVVPEGKLTAFPNCAANESKGISYKHIEDVHIAYQMYLMERWNTDKREPVWS